MATRLKLIVGTRLFWVILLLILVGCSASGPSSEISEPPATTDQTTNDQAESNSEPVTVVLENLGGNMGGHTPRGFQGMGTGLFVGDNLNPGFPQGEGVHLFISFDLSSLPAGEIQSATLRSENVSVQGTPFQDLGVLTAEEIRFDAFSAALWNREPEPDGASCEFATSPDGPFACDITMGVQNSLADQYELAQFRLRLTDPGDSDGEPDMVMFFLSDTNTNDSGIFELEITVQPN